MHCQLVNGSNYNSDSVVIEYGSSIKPINFEHLKTEKKHTEDYICGGSKVVLEKSLRHNQVMVKSNSDLERQLMHINFG